MSIAPGTARSWKRYFAVIVTAALLAPATKYTGRSWELTLLGVLMLGSVAAWLIHRRSTLRTSFLIPLCCIPALAAAYFRVEKGPDSAAFTVALLLFFALCVAGLLVDAFWSARADDLADLEHLRGPGAK